MNSIVVIEDDAAYRDSIALVLTMEGFEVFTAENGNAGIGLVYEKNPDLILCDIMMPGINGHSVLEVIRNNRNFSKIPFIFVTALDTRSDIRSGMTAGADDYLTKPFTAEELIDCVTERLNRFEMLRDAPLHGIPEEQWDHLQKITPRERQILLLVGSGTTSKEIAARFGVSINTVEVHRSNLMKKLRAKNVATLARWALLAEQTKNAK